MRLRKYLLIFSLVGCATVPEKPSPNFCVLDLERSQAICAHPGDANEVKVTLESVNRSVCLTPPEWEKVQNYLDGLQDYARRCR